ncbi:hypothetical protein GCM10023091_28890 [Ravibacter arvi]|uniref:DUF3592 domain-containing protein n=1 Tax=Ravibacter arvi TaxID=2051041 RepID=A0ABP8M4U7_9BACT
MSDLIHGILLVLGLVLVVLGGRLFIASRNLLATGTKTYATVIDNVRTQSRDGHGTSVMYAPVFEYEANGQKKTYVPNTRSNPPAYDVGEKVPIVYSSENASHVRIVSFWGIYLGANILFAMGLPMILLGGGYFLFKTFELHNHY